MAVVECLAWPTEASSRTARRWTGRPAARMAPAAEHAADGGGRGGGAKEHRPRDAPGNRVMDTANGREVGLGVDNPPARPATAGANGAEKVECPLYYPYEAYGVAEKVVEFLEEGTREYRDQTRKSRPEIQWRRDYPGKF